MRLFKYLLLLLFLASGLVNATSFDSGRLKMVADTTSENTYFHGGFAFTADGSMLYHELGSDPVPAGARRIKGIAVSSQGAVYTTTDSPDSGSYVGGVYVRDDGALHVTATECTSAFNGYWGKVCADGAVYASGIAIYGATFDGSNDYLTRDADLTGNSDGDEFTFAALIRPTVDTHAWIYDSGGSSPFYIKIDSGSAKRLFVQGRDSNPTTILQLRGDGNSLSINDWNAIIVSVKLSATATTHMYVNDAEVNNVLTLTEGGTIDFTQTNHAIGAATTGSFKLTGDIRAMGLWMNYWDMSSAANRRLFFNTDNTFAIDIDNNSDGVVDSITPIVWQAGTYDQWHTNKGSGGGFTENGELTQPAD